MQRIPYTLDAAGRRTRIDEGDGTARVYGYDGIDRLTSETVTGATAYGRTFTYDAVGNRTEQVKTGVGAGTTSYSYDSRDRLLTENATTLAYDANGNLTSKSAAATYTWDLENRLIRVVKADGSKVEHVYDAEGNRVKTTVTPAGGGAAKTTKYLVDTAGGLSHVVADVDGATGALSALYVRLGDELLSVMRPAGSGTYSTRWVHHDGIGSVRVLTDENGTTTDTRSYEAFGGAIATAGTDGLAYGFAGEAWEPTSALAYHRARWMDARTGRFISRDTMDTRGGPYRYGDSSPVVTVDPSGHFGVGIAIGIAVVTVMLATADTPFNRPQLSWENPDAMIEDADKAAVAVLESIYLQSQLQGVEYGGTLRKTNRGGSASRPFTDWLPTKVDVSLTDEPDVIGEYHTHVCGVRADDGSESDCDNFSDVDLREANDGFYFHAAVYGMRHYSSYIVTGTGRILRYSPWHPIFLKVIRDKPYGVGCTAGTPCPPTN